MRYGLSSRIIPTLLTTAVLVVSPVIGLASPVSAHADADTVGISIAPANENTLDNRTRYSYQIIPGQKVSDYVRVSNPGSTAITINVFAADAFNAEDGAYSLFESNVDPTDAGSWVRFADNQTRVTLTLSPTEAKIIDFEVNVPASATPGDHAGGIVASASVVGDGQIAVERRVATRMYIRVTGHLQPALTLHSFSATYHGGLMPNVGEVLVKGVIANTGNVALSGTVTLSGSTWFGWSITAPIKVDILEMLPGSTRTISYQLADVPQVGFIQPKLLLRSAVDSDAVDPGPLPVVEREAFVWAIPWLVLAILVVGGTSAWLLVRWRRSRDTRLAAQWIAFTEAEAVRKADANFKPKNKQSTEISATSIDLLRTEETK